MQIGIYLIKCNAHDSGELEATHLFKVFIGCLHAWCTWHHLFIDNSFLCILFILACCVVLRSTSNSIHFWPLAWWLLCISWPAKIVPVKETPLLGRLRPLQLWKQSYWMDVWYNKLVWTAALLLSLLSHFTIWIYPPIMCPNCRTFQGISQNISSDTH